MVMRDSIAQIFSSYEQDLLPFDQCKTINLWKFYLYFHIHFPLIDCKHGKPRRRRSQVDKSPFDRCVLCPDKRIKRVTLFASNYTVSEYKDNVGRVAQMVLDLNIHCHVKCSKRNCKHPFVMDLSKPPVHKSKYTEIPCGIHCAKHKTKKPHQRSHDKCTCETFGIRKQSWDKN